MFYRFTATTNLYKITLVFSAMYKYLPVTFRRNGENVENCMYHRCSATTNLYKIAPVLSALYKYLPVTFLILPIMMIMATTFTSFK